MKTQSYQLTPYPIGSLREIWTVSWPLILGLLSGGLMMFADRILLAQYSIDALNASANSSMSIWALLVAPFTIAGISEVFVGQYHGNGNFARVGSSVWQMIWFALFLSPLFLLVAFFVPPYLFHGTGNEALETAYFAPLVAAGPIFCLIPALIGFFSGLGKVKIVFYINFSANILNIILDYLLIFGWGPIPSYGISGAAWATILSQLVQVAIYFAVFLNSSHRKTYATTQWKLDPHLFWRSLQIGFPAGIAHMSEMAAHAAFFRIMMKTGKSALTIISIVQSLYFLIGIGVEGLSKAVTAVSSNLIGAFHYEKIGKVIRSSILLQLFFASGVFATLFLGSRWVSLLFLGAQAHESLADPAFMRSLHFTILCLCLFFLLDGLGWVFIGLLTAAGDTKFIMLVGFVAQWLFYFTPVYIGVCILSATVVQAWMLICLNSLLVLLIYSYRYRSGQWKLISIRNNS